MSDKSNRGFWSWVGKVAVILGVILALFQIYERVSRNGPKILAVGFSSRFDLPDNIVEATIEAEKPVEAAQVAKALPPQLDKKDELAASIATALTNPLAKKLQDDPKKEILKNFLTIRDLIEVHVTNQGDMQAADLKFECDGCKGFYKLTTLSTQSSFSEFDGSISLGTIRPQNTLNLQIWVDYGFLSRARLSDTRITYPDGVVAIDYPQPLWGWRAWIANNLLFLVIPLLIIFFVLFILVGRGAMKFGATHPREAQAALRWESPSPEPEDKDPSASEHTLMLQVAQQPPALTISASIPDEKT